MKESFIISIESLHVADKGDKDNVSFAWCISIVDFTLSINLSLLLFITK